MSTASRRNRRPWPVPTRALAAPALRALRALQTPSAVPALLLALPVVLALLAPLALLAQIAPLRAATVPAGAPPAPGNLGAPHLARVAPDTAGTILELPSGERLPLTLPAGARLESVAMTAGSWVAAGSAPVAGGPGRELLVLTGRAAPAATAGASPGVPPAASAAVAALTASPAGPNRLPVPPGRATDARRAEPLLLIEDGTLAGMVWLEGDPRAYAVRYAAWNGASWAPPRTISPAGAGNQLALAAARLADGSWLLAWSGFDGRHDAIAWSLSTRQGWTRPQELADAGVPDITPAVAATADGAVLAWSRLAPDGYRLLVSRFAAGAWSAPREVAAGGALYPSFEAAADPDHPRLLYRDAAHRSWAALDLDAAGSVLRRAALPGPAAGTVFDRPALLPPAPQGTTAVFRWPATAATRSAAWTPAAPSEDAAASASVLKTAASGTHPAFGLATALAGSPQTYIAFGDSITAGYGDEDDEGGYPGRLQTMLTNATGAAVTVVNDGLFGETTAEGLSRLPGDLVSGATGLLLMEGTNDVDARVSQATTVQNLDTMASDAAVAGITPFHATLVPRLPSANFDASNDITAALGGAIRELAWAQDRGLVDPFEVFFVLTPNYPQLYVGGTDKLHPNAAGYTLLAQTFANVLLGIDTVPPVPGLLSPPPDAVNVAASAEVEVDLFDFGTGIDVANTQLLLNDQPIATTPSGDAHRLQFRYQPPQPLAGVVKVGIETQDLASPPNTFDGTLSQFTIVGTTFLPGDLNHDGIVDGLDLLLFAPCFGAHRYNSNFQLACDLNGDGVVDGLDLAILAANFGKRSF